MENNYQNQFSQESQFERLRAYFEGVLNPEQMHALEKEALEDPFLQDAMDGYQVSNGVHDFKISLLQKQLADRIAVKEQEKNTFYFSSNRLAIASTAAVLFILAIILFWMRNEILNHRNQEKSVHVELNHQHLSISATSADSVHDTFRPTQGWEALSDYLTHYQQNGAFSSLASGKNDRIEDQRIHVLLKTDSTGKIISIQYLNKVEEDVQRTLNRLLKEGPTWQGMTGEAYISFRP